jgi:hypothetical protein
VRGPFRLTNRAAVPATNGAIVIFVRHSDVPYILSIPAGTGAAYIALLTKALRNDEWVSLDEQTCIRCADSETRTHGEQNDVRELWRAYQ